MTVDLKTLRVREALEKLTVARVTTSATGLAPETSLADAASLMLHSAKGTAPVVEAGRPVGLLTWAALLRALAADTAPTPPRAQRRMPFELASRGAGSAAVEPAQ